MKVQTRVTAQGTEYWDAKEKKVLFVPAGEEPDFEVTKDPKSMVLGKGSDQSEAGDKDVINFSKMTVPQLKEFAAEQEIEIPSDITKKDDIIKFLTDAE
ncbi:hypothetical protein IHV12_15190 [Fictibacillus sp. 7GRE50]|uniref:hypothetical protein n=1 Tax=Fictibacillus sp. 7GRE50 TaxID=2745878 RepID=UPI0018CE4FD4|nr:hypothetical protein [Fictibacillus sp. 7GRE50]MBH0166266.1 hypothetical protein [Fictibacillus sp. 7GRE50]